MVSQWQRVVQNIELEHTAAGTVTDSNRIPFYLHNDIVSIPNSVAKIMNFLISNLIFVLLQEFFKKWEEY